MELIAKFGAHLNRLEGKNYKFTEINFSPNDEHLITSNWDNTVRVWKILDGDTVEEAIVFKGHTDWVSAARFHPISKIAASSGWDKRIFLWDISSGEIQKQLIAHRDAVTRVEFSLDGSLLVSASHDESAIVWDVTTGDIIQTLIGHNLGVTSATINPDKSLIATSSDDQRIMVWELKTGKILHTILVGAMVSNIHFDQTGQRIIASSFDGYVRIWNMLGAEEIFRLNANSGTLWDVNYSADGDYIVTAGSQKKAIIWSLKNNIANPEIVIQDHDDIVSDASFSHDGKILATCSYDGFCRLWRI